MRAFCPHVTVVFWPQGLKRHETKMQVMVCGVLAPKMPRNENTREINHVCVWCFGPAGIKHQNAIYLPFLPEKSNIAKILLFASFFLARLRTWLHGRTTKNGSAHVFAELFWIFKNGAVRTYHCTRYVVLQQALTSVHFQQILLTFLMN